MYKVSPKGEYKLQVMSILIKMKENCLINICKKSTSFSVYVH